MSFPKVLHVVLKGDGITEVVAEDINIGMKESGCEVTMVYLRDQNDCIPSTTADQSVALGINSRFRFMFDWFALRRLSEILRKDSYDVVISHRYKPCLLLMKLIRRFPGVKFVNVVHGTGHYDKPSRRRIIVHLAHERFNFVCVSKAVAEFIRVKCGIDATTSPVLVIPNGIDIKGLDAQQLTREDAREKLGLDPTSFWVGFVGRLIRIKGVVELVEGFSTIAQKYPSAKLAILGKGDLHGELKTLIEAKGLGGRVLLLGQVPLAKQFFKAFDAFILPSYREGMSIALLEAMATGLPLLVSDIPMNTTLVSDSTIVFGPKSSTALSVALDSFLSAGTNKHADEGCQNRAIAEQQYSIEMFRRNYGDLIWGLSGKQKNEAL